ncbi:helix-turn-helix domain-containing protein [bacterium]|nr:helix-turn-helix domain-containing protein [bacterium]
MPKLDTVSINPHALAELIRERQLKQWWLARQIGVTPLTINRWLTGKVRRISPENLQRLSQVLGCESSTLSLKDEVDLRATQVEQSQAARLLVSNESQDMFLQAGHLETYERLIKAVMHPNLALSDLLEIYTLLTLVAGLRGDFERSRNYARMKLDYALRCGDAEKELEGRINLATVEGALGNLTASHKALLELFSAAESQGAKRSMVIALVNLAATYTLLGDLNGALRACVDALELLHDEAGAEELGDSHWILQASSYVYFAASSSAFECADLDLVRLLIEVSAPASEQLLTPIERESLQLLALCCDKLEGKDVDQTALDAHAASFLQFQQYGIGSSVWPAWLLRLSGRLDAAVEYMQAVQDLPACKLYEAAFVAEEWARLEHARGRRDEALRQRERGNELLGAWGMNRRVQPDPALELSGALKAQPRLRSRLRSLVKAQLERQKGG